MTWLERKIDDWILRVSDDSAVHRIPVGPDPEDPTYWRYFIVPRNRFLNFYLHNFRHDDEEHLHDHRMINISILLKGRYFEERFQWMPEDGYSLPPTERKLVKRFIVRLPSTPHRVVLERDVEGSSIAVWSLFIGLPQVRQWGFWCPGWVGWAETGKYQRAKARWVQWDSYVSIADPLHPGYGKAGRGCDEGD